MANGSFLDRVRVMLENLGVNITAGDVVISGALTVSGATILANSVVSLTNLPETSGSAASSGDVYVSSNSTLKLKT